MKIEHLRYFCMVAEQGSISKAARLLFLTQPQLSIIIREMEREMNQQLFVRKADGVALTQAGKRSFAHARKILDEYDRFLGSRGESEPVKTFRLSSVRTSLILDCFLELLRQYDKERIHFSIRETNSINAIEDVFVEDADLAVIFILRSEKSRVVSLLEEKRLAYHRICQLKQHIILSRHHPLLKTGTPITREMLYPYGMLRYWREHMYGEGSADDLWYNSFLDLNQISRFVDVYDRGTMHNLLLNTDFFGIGTDPGIFQENIHQLVSVPFGDESLSPDNILEMGLVVQKASLPLSGLSSEFAGLLNDAYGEDKEAVPELWET